MAKIQKSDENPTPNQQVEEVESPPNRTVTKSETQLAAEKMRDDRALPPKPGSLVTFDEMVSWLELLTPKQLQRINNYVYRSWPEIDRQQVDKTAVKYIDCLALIPSKDYMIENHGGGDYKFKVNDLDSQKTYFEAKLTIPYPEYEPKYDLRETIWTARRNISWVGKLKAEGRIDSKNEVVRQVANQPAQVQGNLDAIGLIKEVAGSYKDMMNTQLAEMRRTMANKEDSLSGISAIIAKQMEANDPSKLAGLISALMPKQDNSMTVVLVELIKQSSQQAQATMTMMLEMMKQNQNSGGGNSKGDSIGFTERLLDLAERIGNRAKDAPEQTTTDKIIDVAERVGVPLIQAVAGAVMAKNSGMPPPNLAGVPAIEPPKPAIPFTGINPYSPEGRAAMAQMPRTEIVNADPNLVEVIRKFHPMIINAMSSGMDGAGFGQSLESFVGLPVVSQLIAHGPTGLVNAAKQVPEFWTVVAPTPERENEVMEWLDDFVHYKQVLASESSDEGK